jgi:hypothetical protein
MAILADVARYCYGPGTGHSQFGTSSKGLRRGGLVGLGLLHDALRNFMHRTDFANALLLRLRRLSSQKLLSMILVSLRRSGRLFLSKTGSEQRTELQWARKKNT